LKFPTREITGAQNFNFTPKFSQTERFAATSLAFLEKNFLTACGATTTLEKAALTMPVQYSNITPCPKISGTPTDKLV